MKMPTKLSKRLERWCEAWQSLDAERVAKLYAIDAVHQSQTVTRAFPENLQGRLKGRQAIAKLAAVGAARLSAIRFEPFAATETENSSVLEYRRIYNNDEASATNVCEVIFWRGEEIVESRVYHA
jgi:hypothetical protein